MAYDGDIAPSWFSLDQSSNVWGEKMVHYGRSRQWENGDLPLCQQLMHPTCPSARVRRLVCVCGGAGGSKVVPEVAVAVIVAFVRMAILFFFLLMRLYFTRRVAPPHTRRWLQGVPESSCHSVVVVLCSCSYRHHRFGNIYFSNNPRIKVFLKKGPMLSSSAIVSRSSCGSIFKDPAAMAHPWNMPWLRCAAVAPSYTTAHCVLYTDVLHLIQTPPRSPRHSPYRFFFCFFLLPQVFFKRGKVLAAGVHRVEVWASCPGGGGLNVRIYIHMR